MRNLNESFACKPHPLNNEYNFIELLIPIDFPNVVVAALDRPRKRNALNSRMWSEIGKFFRNAGYRGDGCRAILLIGKGPAFCAGLDLTNNVLVRENSRRVKDVAQKGLTVIEPVVKEMQDAFTALEKCPVPVVAAVHGKCIGAGVDLITCADVRLCASDTVFSVREVVLGMVADVGTLQRIPKITGNDSLVNELCFTGRDFGANEALRMGLVSRIATAGRDTFFQEALQLCSSIARHSPMAVRGTKQALLYARDHSVADSLDQVAAYNSLALQSKDLAEGMSAYASKTEATFMDVSPLSRL